MMPKSFRDLDVFQIARKLAIEVHKMSLSLPKFELYEEGSQIRRSSKSVVANLVEGFGKRNYKNDFLRDVTIAIAECDETQVHLELLYETGSLSNEQLYKNLSEEYRKLAKMLNRFHGSIFSNHISSR